MPVRIAGRIGTFPHIGSSRFLRDLRRQSSAEEDKGCSNEALRPRRVKTGEYRESIVGKLHAISMYSIQWWLLIQPIFQLDPMLKQSD